MKSFILISVSIVLGNAPMPTDTNEEEIEEIIITKDNLTETN